MLVARTEFLVVVSVQLTVVYGPTTQGIRDPDRLDPAQVASRIVHVEKLFGRLTQRSRFRGELVPQDPNGWKRLDALLSELLQESPENPRAVLIGCRQLPSGARYALHSTICLVSGSFAKV